MRFFPFLLVSVGFPIVWVLFGQPYGWDVMGVVSLPLLRDTVSAGFLVLWLLWSFRHCYVKCSKPWVQGLTTWISSVAEWPPDPDQGICFQPWPHSYLVCEFGKPHHLWLPLCKMGPLKHLSLVAVKLNAERAFSLLNFCLSRCGKEYQYLMQNIFYIN